MLVENDSYHYSLHYQYSQRIRLDQPHPIVDGSFDLSDRLGSLTPKSSLKFYDSDVSKIEKFSRKNQFGSQIFANNLLGQIKYSIDAEIPKVELLDKEEFLAIRWFIRKERKSLEANDGSVITLMYPNGKISMYYEKIILTFQSNEFCRMYQVTCNTLESDQHFVMCN
ncbi:unnamed protein product [Schistosoma margrebowiei]|uniref:Uncharacterized protein n=1 Tax=Schistosoma margrebowiei TaxID=48269 RepID=A0AA85AFR0_9TREM|nr:unnamed protein product [Schistosoma margrebowiei]